MEDNEAGPATQSSDLDIHLDELIMRRRREIHEEICEYISIVGEKEELSALEAEYVTDEVYLSKVKDLLRKYNYMRRTRPDGNCFYRAFAYAYFERLLSHQNEFEDFKNVILKNKANLITSGFSTVTVDDFHETFMEVVDILSKGTSGQDDLIRTFNIQSYSDYVVIYLRLITSSQLKLNADFYQNFIEGGRTIAEFCKQDVELMYNESDHIHIIALSSALEVGVRVLYLDRSQSTEATAHDFPEGSQVRVHLLYRPGHYDILYPVDPD